MHPKGGKYVGYVAERGFFSFWLRRDVYRRERRQDGFFVLKTSHLDLLAGAILHSYLQLQEVERAFRVVKSLLKLRPIYHWRGTPGEGAHQSDACARADQPVFAAGCLTE